MLNRRHFLKKLAVASTGVWLGGQVLPLEVLAAGREYTKITILHTNDVHSRIEPFSRGKHKGLGGAARRAALIKKIREQEKHVLLLDAGDMFQGTPYFNFFGGDLEYQLMNYMAYDAVTIGNHDFDAGLKVLQKQAKKAKFPLLSANYDFAGTEMDGYIKPYHIIEKGGVKIGIFGVGIELDGLVPSTLFGKTKYLDPISKANETAAILKEKENCRLVICLSHLGYKYESDRPSDEQLAQKSSHIDLILGGHTHTFMEKPATLKDLDGETVVVNQVGWAGILLGKIDLYVAKNAKKKRVKSEVLPIS